MENLFNDNEKAVIWLDSLEGLEYKYKKAFMESGENFADLLSRVQDFSDIIGEKSVAQLLAGGTSSVQKLCEQYAKKKIGVAVYGSEKYPSRLYGIDNPPMIIYYKGNTALLNAERTLAIVGSRKTPAAMVEIAGIMSENISEKYCIITGLAEGADIAALKGALKNKNAISVLAYGFDHVFPSVNREILQRAEQGGLVVTEHIPSVEPRGYLFPARNRIIAGLGDGALIVSAAKKSGALITAEYAEKYGKKLFAFPYSINVKAGEGCNNLIKRGATLCESAADIFETFGDNFEKKHRAYELNEQEEKIFMLFESGQLHIDKIIELSGMEFSKLSPILMMLEIKGLIKAESGNLYSALF